MNIQSYIEAIPAGLSEDERENAENIFQMLYQGEVDDMCYRDSTIEDPNYELAAKSLLYLMSCLAYEKTKGPSPISGAHVSPKQDYQGRDIIPFSEFYKKG